MEGLVGRFGAPLGGSGGAAATANASSGFGGSLFGFEDSAKETLQAPLGGTGGAASTVDMGCGMEDAEVDLWDDEGVGVGWERSTLVHRVLSL